MLRSSRSRRDRAELLELDGSTPDLHAVERERRSDGLRTKCSLGLRRAESNEGTANRLALGQLGQRAVHELDEPYEGSRQTSDERDEVRPNVGYVEADLSSAAALVLDVALDLGVLDDLREEKRSMRRSLE